MNGDLEPQEEKPDELEKTKSPDTLRREIAKQQSWASFNDILLAMPTFQPPIQQTIIPSMLTKESSAAAADASRNSNNIRDNRRSMTCNPFHSFEMSFLIPFGSYSQHKASRRNDIK